MRVAAAAALALVALALTASASSAPTRVGVNGLFAFTSELRASEAYIADADGKNVRRLTNDPGISRWPALSPDGTRVAFASKRANYWQIHVMNLDGTDVQQITNDFWFDGYPDWSPDGSKLAFAHTFGEEMHIIVYDFSDGRRCGATSRRTTPSPITHAGRRTTRYRLRLHTLRHDYGAQHQRRQPRRQRPPPAHLGRRLGTAARLVTHRQIAYTGYPTYHTDIFVMNEYGQPLEGHHPDQEHRRVRAGLVADRDRVPLERRRPRR